MRRFLAIRDLSLCRRWGLRCPLALLAAAGLAAALSGSAAASDPADATAVPRAPSLAENAGPARGAFCTPLGCRRPPASWAKTAAFGVALLAAGWMGRRARAPRP